MLEPVKLDREHAERQALQVSEAILRLGSISLCHNRVGDPLSTARRNRSPYLPAGRCDINRLCWTQRERAGLCRPRQHVRVKLRVYSGVGEKAIHQRLLPAARHGMLWGVGGFQPTSGILRRSEKIRGRRASGGRGRWSVSSGVHGAAKSIHTEGPEQKMPHLASQSITASRLPVCNHPGATVPLSQHQVSSAAVRSPSSA